MIYLKLIIPIFTLTISFLSLALQENLYKLKETNSKLYKSVLLSIAILLFTSTVITCVIVYRDFIDSRQLTNKLESVQNELQIKSDSIIYLTKAYSAKLELISNNQTGGNSFCFFGFYFKSSSDTLLTCILKHYGKYPIYDLHIRLVDSDKLTSIGEKYLSDSQFNIPEKEFKKAEYMIYKPFLFKRGQGNMDSEYMNIPLNAKHLSFSIFFTARNGEWHQYASFYRIDNKWLYATKVTITYSDIVLYENIPKNFPKDKNGNPIW